MFHNMKEVFLYFCRLDASKECRNWIENFWDQLRKDSKLARCCMDSSKFAEKKGIMRMSQGMLHNMNYNKLSIFEIDDLREICHYHDCKCYYCLARPYLQEEKRECWERKSAMAVQLFSLCIYFSLRAIVLRRCTKGTGESTIIQWERILILLGLYWLHDIAFAFGNQGKRARYMISWREREQLIEMVL